MKVRKKKFMEMENRKLNGMSVRNLKIILACLSGNQDHFAAYVQAVITSIPRQAIARIATMQVAARTFLRSS